MREQTEKWYRTPAGVLRQMGAFTTKNGVAGHWYLDKEDRWRAFADNKVKKTRKPTWARRQELGRQLLSKTT